MLQKFLMRIPGGVFGAKVEKRLLGVLELDNRMEQYDTIHRLVENCMNACPI